MLTLNLSTGHYSAVGSKGKTLTVDYLDGDIPNGITRFQRNDEVPPIAEVYDMLKERGVDDDELLDTLIDMYVPVRFFNAGFLADMTKTIGFIGKRGAGKSASMVNVAVVDYLLRNRPVYSNVNIAVRVVYRDLERIYRSHKLDTIDLLELAIEQGQRACVAIDEVNMSAAESTKFMSNANLQFSYAMQQIRKVGLDVMWSCQGWEWVDNRMRWQTDFVVVCRDAFLEQDPVAQCLGDYCKWRVCDLSGLTGQFDERYDVKHKFILDYEIWNGVVWNRPIWPAYDTREAQGEESYVTAYRESQAWEKQARNLELSMARELPAQELAESMKARGIESFYADQFWNDNGVTDKSEKTRIGIALQKYFVRKRDSAGKYFYVLREKA